MNPKENAILFGPFIGELWWEIFYFAGFFVYQRHQHQDCKAVVLTRSSRFDLYGSMCDTLIPLKLQDERNYTQDCFTMKGMSQEYYTSIVKKFRAFCESKYKIKEHYFPDVGLRYNLKWQFPRRERLYEFRPRLSNKDLVKKIVHYSRRNLVVTDLHDLFELSDHEVININHFLYDVNRLGKDNKSISELGCIIELLKTCRFFVGNLQSITTKLALLMNVPIIALNESYTDDAISLLNKNGEVFKCTNIERGVIMYEDSLRFKKDRTRK